jgi:hypothetical protein
MDKRVIRDWVRRKGFEQYAAAVEANDIGVDNHAILRLELVQCRRSVRGPITDMGSSRIVPRPDQHDPERTQAVRGCTGLLDRAGQS